MHLCEIHLWTSNYMLYYIASCILCYCCVIFHFKWYHNLFIHWWTSELFPAVSYHEWIKNKHSWRCLLVDRCSFLLEFCPLCVSVHIKCGKYFLGNWAHIIPISLSPCLALLISISLLIVGIQGLLGNKPDLATLTSSGTGWGQPVGNNMAACSG